MANPWFRLYAEFASDPKVQMMPEVMQRRLIMLLCSRCNDETLHETEMAFHWRVTAEEVAQTKRLFVAKGFIDEGWKVLNWNKRQYISDSSTERVRRFRSGLKQGETFLKHQGAVTVTAPEQNRTEHNIKNKGIETETQKQKRLDAEQLEIYRDARKKNAPIWQTAIKERSWVVKALEAEGPIQ